MGSMHENINITARLQKKNAALDFIWVTLLEVMVLKV